MANSRILETDLLVLEPFSEKHLTQRYLNWFKDPVATRLSEHQHRTYTMESCKAYMESFEHSPNYFWAAVTKDSDLGHIGNLTATVDPRNRVADLAIFIGETRAWGKGYGFDAWKTACDFLSNDCTIRKVSAGTTSLNKAMLRIMRKAGMVEDGVRRRALIVDGREVDHHYFAIFRDE